MNLTVLACGSIKEGYLREACREYGKRLSAYCKLNVIEVKDEKTPDDASSAMERKIKDAEGERLLSKLPPDAFLVALSIDGKRYSSEEFSRIHEAWEVKSRGKLYFVIGGSLGLSDAVLSRADERMSFSDLTFPHQLMRVILLEQVYRSYRIRNHQPYHK